MSDTVPKLSDSGQSLAQLAAIRTGRERLVKVGDPQSLFVTVGNRKVQNPNMSSATVLPGSGVGDGKATLGAGVTASLARSTLSPGFLLTSMRLPLVLSNRDATGNSRVKVACSVQWESEPTMATCR